MNVRLRPLVLAVAMVAGPVSAFPSPVQPPCAAGQCDDRAVVAAGDLDGDGRPDIATVGWNGTMLEVRARRGRDGAVLWSRGTAASDAWVQPMRFGPGDPGLLIHSWSDEDTTDVGTVQAVAANGSVRWRIELPASRVLMLGSFVSAGATDALVATGVRAEAGIAASGVSKLFVVRGSDGALFAGATIPDSTRVSAAGDLDGDGLDDLIATTVAGSLTIVRALRGRDGLPLWVSPVPDIVVGATGLGDLSGDGRGEVAVESTSEDGTPITRLLDGATGTVRWTRAGRASNAGDVDGDGRSDALVLAARSTDAGPVATLAAVTADGAEIYRTSRGLPADGADGQRAAIEPAGDLDGDGITDALADLIVTDAGGSRRRIVTAMSGRDGSDLWTDALDSGWIAPLGSAITGTAGDVARAIFDETDFVVHLGVLDGATKTALWSLDLPWGLWVLEPVGDVDGDGFADVALSRGQAGPLATGRENAFASVHSGRDGHVLWAQVS